MQRSKFCSFTKFRLLLRCKNESSSQFTVRNEYLVYNITVLCLIKMETLGNCCSVWNSVTGRGLIMKANAISYGFPLRCIWSCGVACSSMKANIISYGFPICCIRFCGMVLLQCECGLILVWLKINRKNVIQSDFG